MKKHIIAAQFAFATNMGSFTYDVITLGGGGGFQMMTIDDEGGRGGFGQ